MKAKKKKAPTIKYEKQGLSGNRYIVGENTWAVSNLINYCKEQNYPTFKIPLAALDLSQVPWDINSLDDFIWHYKRCEDTNDYPIILDDYGRICDGYHRVCKAIINNKTEIDGIRIETMPKPDGIKE